MVLGAESLAGDLVQLSAVGRRSAGVELLGEIAHDFEDGPNFAADCAGIDVGAFGLG